MPIDRFHLPKRREPLVCCVLCGLEIPTDADDPNVTHEREDWKAMAEKLQRRKRPSRRLASRSLIVPATDFENVEFRKNPPQWLCFHRTILDDPKTNKLQISGISHGYFGWYPRPAPVDPNRAVIYRGAIREDRRWNVEFHMANLFEPDWNREAGERVGYPIHVHCWLLLDRFIAHNVIKQNLRLFIQVIEEFWKANKEEWGRWVLHILGDPDPEMDGCYEDGIHWLKRQSDPPKPMNIGVLDDEKPRPVHWPANPLRIPDIQELTERVTRSYNHLRLDRHPAKAANLPLDIAMIIIDTIYQSQPHSRQRIEDTRNILVAFGWTLPNAYWQSRCNPRLVFEVDDLIKAGRVIDWVEFCLGLEELLLDEDWYCNSGLNNRGRILKLFKGIKEQFDKTIKQENRTERA